MPVALPIIGLVTNPMSSKDIRRLVGLARVIDVEEKANLIARLLVGMTAGPPLRVLALDDSAGLVRRAVGLAGSHAPPVDFLGIDATATEEDTRRAAAALRDSGARALVTVGGDGTIRSAVEGWPDALLVPIAAGTNNAVAIPDEPTIIGRAANHAVTRELPSDALTQLTALTLESGEGRSAALIDVVGVRTMWLGSRALWEPGEFVEAVVANPRPTAVGVASIAAALGPLPPRHARHIRFGPGRELRVVLGPGLVTDVSVAGFEDVPEGRHTVLDPSTRVVALDGERRLIRSEVGHVDVAAGPHLLSVHRALGDPNVT